MLWGKILVFLCLGLAAAHSGQAPTFVGLTVPSVTQSNALVRARFNPNTTGAVHAWFNYGKTTNIANRTSTQVLTGGTNSILVSNLLTQLGTNQTYYFRCTVSNQFGVTPSPIASFRTLHDVQFQDLSATNIESDRALLAGTFTAVHSGKTWFEWGTSSNLSNSTVRTNYIAGASTISITNLLTGLTPNKTYYYRVMASNQFGISGSAVSNFTTLLNFAVKTVEAHTYCTAPTYVWLTGTISNFWLVTAWWFEWGTDTNNLSMSNPREQEQNPWGDLYKLQPNTLYYCRLVATNVYGRDSTPWTTFRTPIGLIINTYAPNSGNEYPRLPGYPQGIGAMGSTTARLGARIDNVLPPTTDAWFEWGTSTNYGNRTESVTFGLGELQLFANIAGLQEAGVTYHYRAVASNTIGIAYGTNQTFSTPLFPLALISSNLPGVTWGRALWGDYNNDGRLDIFIGGDIGQIWRNTGTGFEIMQSGLPGLFRWPTSLNGDYDNDDRLDILLAPVNYELFGVWRNNGQVLSNTLGLFPAQPGPPGNRLAWADYDNDGRIDIVAEDYYEPAGFYIWRNTTTGLVQTPLSLTPLIRASITSADYDNNGWCDILIRDPWVGRIWKNTGGHFSNFVSDIAGPNPGSTSWGDYDNDGLLDLALLTASSNGTPGCAIWRNTGSGFSNVITSLPPFGSLSDEYATPSASWGDYDNDGRLDLLLYGVNADGLPRLDEESLCQIWRNTGIGFTNINAGLPKLWDGSAAWGDYDNDGRLDVLMTGRKSQWASEVVTEIYRNVHAPPNSPPSAPTGLRVFRTDFGVAFTWLAATDAQTPSSGLSYNIRAGSAPGQGDLVSANALPDGKRLLLQLGNAQMRRFAYLTGLTNGQTVYWSVQAIDTAFAGGPFAPEQTFVYPPANAWSVPALSIVPGKLTFTSSLPLPFTIYTSTNLVDWERYLDAHESSPGVYETPLQATGSVRFFTLRSP